MIGNGGLIGKRKIITPNSRNLIFGLDDFFNNKNSFPQRQISYVGATNSTFAVSTTQNISLTSLTGGIDSSARENDVVIVYLFSLTTSNHTMTVTGYDTIANLYTNATALDQRLLVQSKRMGSVPDTQVTFQNVSTAPAGIIVQVYRGVASGDILEVSATTAGTTGDGTVIPPPITPISSKQMIVSGGGSPHGANVIYTPSSTDFDGFVNIQSQTTTGGMSMLVGRKVSTEPNVTFTPNAFTYSPTRPQLTNILFAAVSLVLRA